MTKEEIVRKLRELAEVKLPRQVYPGLYVVSEDMMLAIMALAKEAADEIEFRVDIPIYDQEEIHHGCTVQVLTSSVTGESSVGWWKEEECEN